MLVPRQVHRATTATQCSDLRGTVPSQAYVHKNTTTSSMQRHDSCREPAVTLHVVKPVVAGSVAHSLEPTLGCVGSRTVPVRDVDGPGVLWWPRGGMCGDKTSHCFPWTNPTAVRQCLCGQCKLLGACRQPSPLEVVPTDSPSTHAADSRLTRRGPRNRRPFTTRNPSPLYARATTNKHSCSQKIAKSGVHWFVVT